MLLPLNPEQPKLSLSYLLRRPKTEIARPPVLILLHGYGSNEADLFALASDMPPEFLVISARAPRVLGEGQYAWFSLDFSSGTIVANKEEAEECRLLLKQFIDEVAEKFAIDTSRIFLLGFSQGAILSLSVALTFPPLVKGIVVLSGRVLKEIRPLVRVTPELKKLKVFLGHGTKDETLPVHFAHEAKAYLEELGVDLTYHEYPIPHSISRDEQTDFLEWLKNSSRN